MLMIPHHIEATANPRPPGASMITILCLQCLTSCLWINIPVQVAGI